ncbi:MAG: hypothetical protein Q7J43_13930 [Pseudomonas sp.]|uniref:HEPN domain-containing protein n=1 Tax=Pseudomonas sp. TaxID=306 RepID=UPI00271799F4|nr:HEPN domain-containing protein [Pseudomonas sp.]MDO9618764.1 hypothetical protein [Pseudomonas sp.]MDP2445851.1 hypothetical protein [Pseudomonas sp.]MDZ4337654.1 hypothetical protein [Pseudomonas sp.]
MQRRPEELLLNESYEFNVTVKATENYFSAKLKLTPKSINLRVTGEESEGRKYSGGWSDLETLTCQATNTTFILTNLKIQKSTSGIITQNPKLITFFEIDYIVEYLIMTPSDTGLKLKFNEISIYSETLNKWIGHTRIQRKIIDSYHNKTIPEHFNEFREPLNKHLTLGASYSIKTYSSSSNFEAGINFPPLLYLRLDSSTTAEKIIAEYNRLYAILSTITGSNLSVQKIQINYNSSHHKKASLYYTNKAHKPNFQNTILFPLGKDIWTGPLTPEFPLEAFSQYFKLPETEQSYFAKYLKYREMNNNEDRFLGYFRILESLCFNSKKFINDEILNEIKDLIKTHLTLTEISKKDAYSFIRGLDRYNNSKYNTEKCITDFFKRIPDTTKTQWKFNNDSIKEICKLRNDITHANNYYYDEASLHGYTKFAEALLIIALLEKIGIHPDISGKIIKRMDGHFWITASSAAVNIEFPAQNDK